MAGSGHDFESTIIPNKAGNPKRSRPLPCLTIIAHPDLGRIGDRALLRALAKGGSVALSRTVPSFHAPGRAWGQPLADPFISREPVLLATTKDGAILLGPGNGKIPLAVGERALDGEAVFSEEDLKRGVVIVLAERVVLYLHSIDEAIQSSPNLHGLIGFSDQVLFLRGEIDRVADQATPVLLTGASGTGKELVARAIHEAGRQGKPFVGVNMGAIPPTLAASELFGAVKGSFTGASRDQSGYFRTSEGGSLFLDEIGEASVEVQVMLLRTLETGEISPVGAQSPVRVNTRLIAATDADLEAKMEEDSFKTPLFHRLAGYEISLPPLTQRLEDFGRMFLHFARGELAMLEETDRLKPRGSHDEPWLPAHLMVQLLHYSWPGNIRQLRNAVRQLLIGCRGENSLHMVPKLESMLGESKCDGPASKPKSETQTGNGNAVTKTPRRKPRNIQANELKTVLKAHRWNIKAAAEELAISRAALYLLIEKTPGLQKVSDLEPNQIKACLAKNHGDVDAAADALGVSPFALRRRITKLDLA